MKKLLIIPLAVVGLFLFSNVAEAAGLRAYYPLDADILDYAGDADLEPGNMTTYPDGFVSGILDGSLGAAFAGAGGDQDGGLTTCSEIDMDYNDVFSISLWMNSTTTGQTGYMVNARCATRGKISIFFDGGTLWAWTGAGANYLTGANINDGDTHFVVVTGDGTTLRLYVDNVLVDSDDHDQDTSGANDAFAVGSSFQSGDEYSGILDDVAVWDDTLDAGDIDDLWNGGDGLVAGEAGGPDTYATFLYPTSSSTVATQFSWQVEYVASSSVSAKLAINVCPYLTNCARFDTYLASFLASPTPHTATFFTLAPLSPGIKTAVVYLRRASDDSLLATSSVTFTVSGNVAGGGSFNTTTTFGARIDELRASLDVDCDEFDFWETLDVFGYDLVPWPNVDDWFPGTYCYAKKTAYAAVDVAVVPHDYSLEFVDYAFAGVRDVFPFNGFFAIRDGAEAAASNVTSSEAVWTLPAIGSITDAMPIVTSSTLANFMGSSNKELLFDTERAIMWAGAGVLAMFMVF